MLGRVVWGSRTWMCTIAAPALAASMADCAICCGVTGTAGFLPGVSAEPVTAQEIITFRAMPTSLKRLNSFRRGALAKGARLCGARQAPRAHDGQELAADGRYYLNSVMLMTPPRS